MTRNATASISLLAVGTLACALAGGDASPLAAEGDGIRITLETDPEQLNREKVGETVTRPDGTFTIKLRQPGARVLIYDVGLEARASGYQGVQHLFRLPPQSRRVLIMLRPGPNQLPEREESLYEQYERFR